MCRPNNDNNSDSFNQSFEFLWNSIIFPTIKAAEEDVNEEFKKACNLQFAYSDIDKYKDDLMNFYHEKRQWLKGVYLPHDEHPMLDMHKIGAILCRCLLAYKPFYFDYPKAEKYVVNKFGGNKENHIDWFIDNIYVNYKVAFYVSTGLVYIELLDSYSPNGNFTDLKALRFFLDLGGIMYYAKSPTHDNYVNSCILALQKNDVLHRNFDYLSYAINLFQLESFNRMYYQLNIQQNIKE